MCTYDVNMHKCIKHNIHNYYNANNTFQDDDIFIILKKNNSCTNSHNYEAAMAFKKLLQVEHSIINSGKIDCSDNTTYHLVKIQTSLTIIIATG